MDVRKKLVELLGADICKYNYCEDCECFENEEECLATIKYSMDDHLIANGVTVQEWISVDDRLPEDDSDALAYLQIGEECRIYPANYAKGVWFDCIFKSTVTESTTHWMPLPCPPKGE